MRSVYGLPVDKCVEQTLLERIPDCCVSWERHLIRVPRVIHSLFHKTSLVANYGSLTFPHEATQKPPLIGEIRACFRREKAGRTINYPKIRTIVLGSHFCLVYGIQAYGPSPLGRNLSLDCSDPDSILLISAEGGGHVHSHSISLGIRNL